MRDILVARFETEFGGIENYVINKAAIYCSINDNIKRGYLNVSRVEDEKPLVSLKNYLEFEQRHIIKTKIRNLRKEGIKSIRPKEFTELFQTSRDSFYYWEKEGNFKRDRNKGITLKSCAKFLREHDFIINEKTGKSRWYKKQEQN